MPRGSTLPGASKWQISNVLGCEHQEGDATWSLLLSHRYVSRAPGALVAGSAISGASQGGYHLFNARAGVSDDRYGVTLFVDNIGDSRGVTSGSADPLEQFIVRRHHSSGSPSLQEQESRLCFERCLRSWRRVFWSRRAVADARESAAKPTAPLVDHHMHIQSIAVSEMMQTVKEKAPEAFKGISDDVFAVRTGADALRELDRAGIRQGVLLSAGYMFGSPLLKLDPADAARRTHAEKSI